MGFKSEQKLNRNNQKQEIVHKIKIKPIVLHWVT